MLMAHHTSCHINTIACQVWFSQARSLGGYSGQYPLKFFVPLQILLRAEKFISNI